MTVSHNPPGRIAAMFLLFLGFVDLVRGILHTYFIHWANDTFAHLDLSVNGQDQLVLLSAFGISNWLTGMLFILIALKAKVLAEAALLLILVAYAVGWLGMPYAVCRRDAKRRLLRPLHHVRLFWCVCIGVGLIGV